MMNEPAVLPNFDPIAIGVEVAALETEAQSKLADAKGEFASRSVKIAAILWDVKQHHPEHLNAICEQAKIGRSRRKELLQIGRGSKTIDQSRRESAERQTKSRANKTSKADKPTLDPRAWSKSTPQEREAFVKAVGRRDIDDIINALEPSRGFDTLKQAWNAVTPAERKAFATEYHDEINTLGWKQKW
jgi:hypothetical protein